jgi:hypothetical protein
MESKDAVKDRSVGPCSLDIGHESAVVNDRKQDTFCTMNAVTSSSLAAVIDLPVSFRNCSANTDRARATMLVGVITFVASEPWRRNVKRIHCRVHHALRRKRSPEDAHNRLRVSHACGSLVRHRPFAAARGRPVQDPATWPETEPSLIARLLWFELALAMLEACSHGHESEPSSSPEFPDKNPPSLVGGYAVLARISHQKRGLLARPPRNSSREIGFGSAP